MCPIKRIPQPLLVSLSLGLFLSVSFSVIGVLIALLSLPRLPFPQQTSFISDLLCGILTIIIISNCCAALDVKSKKFLNPRLCSVACFSRNSTCELWVQIQFLCVDNQLYRHYLLKSFHLNYYEGPPSSFYQQQVPLIYLVVLNFFQH